MKNEQTDLFPVRLTTDIDGELKTLIDLGFLTDDELSMLPDDLLDSIINSDNK